MGGVGAGLGAGLGEGLPVPHSAMLEGFHWPSAPQVVYSACTTGLHPSNVPLHQSSVQYTIILAL